MAENKVSSLASVSATREVLEAFGLSTKYSLGQNFLINDAIVGKIVSLAELFPEDNVLEVGPGIGTLTVALLQNAKRVLSIERDEDLIPVLAQTTAPWADRFELACGDALAFDGRNAGNGRCAIDGNDSCASDISDEDVSNTSWPFVFGTERPESFKLVSNLPYAVAATIVLDYFQRFECMESATVMVQREVADRMQAKPGTKDYGAYSVKLALYAEPVGRFAVGPGNFFPPPRVESAVIRLNRRRMVGLDGTPLSAGQLRATCKMADAAFANRRKTLMNSCKAYFASSNSIGGEKIAELFEGAEIDPRRRGETLSLEEFVSLGLAYCSLLGRDG